MPAREVTDPWRVLGIQPGASAEEVRQAYMRLVKLHHPDQYRIDDIARRRHEQQMKEITAAYRQIREQPFSKRSRGGSRSTGRPSSAMATHCEEHGRWAAIYCTHCGRALCTRCDPSLSGLCRDHRTMH